VLLAGVAGLDAGIGVFAAACTGADWLALRAEGCTAGADAEAFDGACSGAFAWLAVFAGLAGASEAVLPCCACSLAFTALWTALADDAPSALC